MLLLANDKLKTNHDHNTWQNNSSEPHTPHNQPKKKKKFTYKDRYEFNFGLDESHQVGTQPPSSIRVSLLIQKFL